MAGQVVANTWVPMGSKNSRDVCVCVCVCVCARARTCVCHSLSPNLAWATSLVTKARTWPRPRRGSNVPLPTQHCASSSTPATWAVISSRPTPGTLTSGPLHWLFPQLRILFPQISPWLPPFGSCYYLLLLPSGPQSSICPCPNFLQ